MILTFFTSNTTKLAHARYIAQQFPFRIFGFRQRTYHADYIEPQIQCRSELLERSYNNALIQCKKTGIDPSRHIFFLEDTSVRIEALSTKDHSKPGVDIKYWMKDNTFELLDKSLKKAGNDRRVIVRSDVLLHVPDDCKETWKIQDNYIIFEGSQRGYVVKAEFNYDTNLVYPWLDNETFNKWFQPEGANKPLGALDIKSADKYDFRRESFVQMFRFLKSKNQIQKPKLQQTLLRLENRPNLILCGYTCAGKTTAGQYLAKNYGFLHIEASDFMHLSYYQRHGFKGVASIDEFAEQALTQEPQIAAKNIVEHIEQHLLATMVISGFRSIEEIYWLLDKLSYSRKFFQIIFIDSEQNERYHRLQKRMRTGDDLNFCEFRKKDEKQKSMGLEYIRKATNTRLWSNADSLESYFKLVDAYIKKESTAGIELDKTDYTDLDYVFDALKEVKSVKLEDAIQIGLLSKWSSNESRQYYSTTEISGIINEMFTGIPPKYKDNVSRYFNQDFRPYYEIKIDDQTNIRKYCLSNTGYGQALKAIKLNLNPSFRIFKKR